MEVTLVDKMGSDLEKERKSCSGCGKTKDDCEFPLRKDRSNRRRPYCFICTNNISRARYKKYKENSPFKLKSNRAKSRSQFLKVPFNLTPEYLESIWTGICPVFGSSIYLDCDRLQEDAAELDRFKPELGYIRGNVTFISRRANRIKNNVTKTEINQLANWMNSHED